MNEDGSSTAPIKFEQSSVMTSDTLKKSIYSENRRFARWDESGLHNPLSYNEKINKKYGKKPSSSMLACREFGRPSKDHSFTADVVFDHILLHIFKTGFFNQEELACLRQVHPLYNHLSQVMTKTLNVDFSGLAKHDLNYESQTEVTQDITEFF